MERPKKENRESKGKNAQGREPRRRNTFSPFEYFIILLSDEPQTTVPNHRRPEICRDFF